jgi:hypothetical protein
MVNTNVLTNNYGDVYLIGSTVNNLTGLTPGAMYYLDNNAFITTTQTPKQIGIAS